MVDISRAHSDREGVCRFLLSFFQFGSDRVVTRDAKVARQALWRAVLAANFTQAKNHMQAR